MIVLNKAGLAFVRTSLLLNQKELAQRAGVGIMTVSRCERGEEVQLLSAQKILAALNAVRKERDLPPLQFEDIDWKIRQ
jgi:transcriptional regulator with XRE-family HTH domain